MVKSTNSAALTIKPLLRVGQRPMRMSLAFMRAWSPRAFRVSPRLVGALIVTLIISGALCAPLITSHDPLAQDLSARLHAPSAQFWFGTDALGRDVWSRVWFGARASLLIAGASTLLAFSLGVSLGLIAGFMGERADTWLSRIADIQQAIPYLILAIAVVAVLGSSAVNLILILGATSWLTFFRVTRAQTLVLRIQEFVLAAQALGATRARIILRHILPNLWSSLGVLATLLAAQIILFEASLGFLGLGVPPPQPSWGSLIADGRDYIADAWWIALMPGLMLLLLGLGLNGMGDVER